MVDDSGSIPKTIYILVNRVLVLPRYSMCEIIEDGGEGGAA